MGNYKELLFYQRARQVVKAADALVKSWAKTMQAQEVSRQLFRSATLVGANIAEGHGRHQGTEYIHFLIIAQGSSNETEHWFQTAKDCGLGPNDKIDEILRLNIEVIRMITTTIYTIRGKPKQITEEKADYLIDSDSFRND